MGLVKELVDLFRDFTANPIGFSKLFIRKLLLDPLKYRRGKDYDASSYWRDRFSRHQC